MQKVKMVMALFLMSLMLVPMAQADNALREQAKGMIVPIPSAPPALKGNQATLAKVELGKVLYFDPRLSRSALISCNTCHNVGLGGADFQETSTGHGWQRGPRNAPTVHNSVYNFAQFWDGRAKDLAEQAKGPVQAGVEMNNTPENVIITLKSMPEYIALFQKAFPGEKDPVTFDNMAKAIEVFEATLVTPGAPLDRFIEGDDKALTETEKKGLQAFLNKGCVDCHSGINMGGDDYYGFGVEEAPAAEIMAGDAGRYKVTAVEDDRYNFKSPSLRNIELTMPYFHSGKVWRLRDAVAVMSTSQLGTKLTDAEVDEVAAFLKSTTGIQPVVDHPILPKPTDKTLKPDLAMAGDKSH
ncbi:MAG: cytochrome-c peroxidase [Deltaproteobacteria bacterium]|nr:cytochrome-c peroxidase [Candidatus Anaeroferrophillus wilburensis]MBN2887978.1 cytochrome-c peroxidase [Deltaproteobacteria bacterium]